jgi:hypothetical protein
VIFVDRRRHTFAPELLWRVCISWLLVGAIMVATHWGAILTKAQPDPDDTLRMVQIRDLFAGQSWWDLHQYRIAPPDGVLMHWSRLVDVPLWLVQALLRPVLGPALAEHVAIVLVPLITLGCVMLLAARLAWRMLVRNELIFVTCVMVALAIPVTVQLQPLRIDHHGWQIVAVLGALNGLTARTSRKAGWIAGFSIALGLSISLELLPIAALFAGVLVLRGFADPAERWTAAAFLQALALTAVVTYAVSHGAADLANHCDSVSPAWLAALLVAAAGTTAVAALPPLPLARVVIAYGMTAALSLLTLVAIAPQCTAGPFAGLDPLVRSFWYDNVHEGKPIWLQKFPSMAQMLLPPLLGLWAALKLRAAQAGWLRRFWGEYALVLAGLIVLSIAVARSASISCAVATVPLAWQILEWNSRVYKLKRMGRILGIFAMAFAVVPGIPLLVVSKAIDNKTEVIASGGVQQICDMDSATATLAALPSSTVFTQIDLGPAILATTPHKVVATAHHRAPKAMHDLIAASIGSPDAARKVLDRYGVRYVMVCPGLPETGNYRGANAKGFIPQLAEGKAPAWLKPLPVPKKSGLLLWEIQAGTKTSASPLMQ